MPKVYGYARASTSEQEETLILQQAAIEKEYHHRFATDHEWGGVTVEKGVSGSVPLGNRPMGVKLLTALEPGDVIIVTKLDRGFRNLRDLANTMAAWDKKGVRFLLLDLNLDTGTPVGRLILYILGAVAEFERMRIGERMRDFQRSRKLRGLPHAAIPPYGFKLVGPKGNKKFAPDPYTRAFGRMFVKWTQEGWTTDQIYFHLLGKKLKTRTGKEWARSVIWRTIRKERALQAQEMNPGTQP